MKRYFLSVLFIAFWPFFSLAAEYQIPFNYPLDDQQCYFFGAPTKKFCECIFPPNTSSTCYGLNRSFCAFSEWGLYNDVSFTRLQDGPADTGSCYYTYHDEIYPVSNGVSSGYKLSSDKPGLSATEFPADKTRKYLQFDWKPVTELTRTFSKPGVFIAPEKKATSYQLIWFQEGSNPEQGPQFFLPGSKANRFKIDFQKLDCRDHVWKISTVALYWESGHQVGGISASSDRMPFSKLCCPQAPSVTLVAPPNNSVFPANTTTVPLVWSVNPNCSYPNAALYNRAHVTAPNTTVETLEFNPAYPMTNKNYEKTYSTLGLNRCSDTASSALAEYKWYAEAATLDKMADSNVGRSGDSNFYIAPNFVEVTGMVQNPCNEAGEVPVTITLNDQNRMNDRYRFEFSSTTQLTVSKTLDQDSDCNTASDGVTVTCNVSPTLGIGTYTLKVYTINECDQTERLLTKGGNPAQYSIGVNEDIMGTLDLMPSKESNSDFTLALVVQNSSPADYFFEYSSGSCAADCSSCSSYSPISDLPSSDGVTPVSANYSCPQDAMGKCVTDDFTFPGPGSYCFRSTATANGCSKTNNQKAQVYVVNVRLSRDADDNLSCKRDSTPEIGTPLNREKVTLDISPNDGDADNGTFERYTDPAGVARFTANFAAGGGEVLTYTNCGGDPNNSSSGCISDNVCRDVYLDCAGLGPDGPFEEVLTYGFLGLPTTLSITSPTEYNVYMRVGTIATPKEWMTSAHGDVYAPGMSLNWCNETSQDGTYFDGSLLERPEGNPYRKFSAASPKGKPYTGGFVFSQANIVGKDVERLGASDARYYLSEPDTVGRYAFNLAKDGNNDDIQDSFKDARFDLLMTEPLRVPSTVDSLSNNKVDSEGVFETDDLSDMISEGGYRLAGGKIAVLYYTGSDDIEFNNPNGFRNLSGTDGRLVIITNSDVTIDPSIGYECEWDSLTGTGSCGKYSPVLVDYQPSDTQFRSNIEATILTSGVITITPNSLSKPMKMENDVDDMKVLKIGGSLIAGGDSSGSPGVEFGRVLGLLSARYPGEFVSYDSNMLYRLTKLDRDAIRPVTGFTQSSVETQYGY